VVVIQTVVELSYFIAHLVRSLWLWSLYIIPACVVNGNFLDEMYGKPTNI